MRKMLGMWTEGSIYSLPLVEAQASPLDQLVDGDFDKKFEFFRESDAVMTLLGGCSPRGKRSLHIYREHRGNHVGSRWGEYVFFYSRIDG